MTAQCVRYTGRDGSWWCHAYAADRDTHLAQALAAVELEHCAEQFSAVAQMAGQDGCSQAQLATARRRLQEAAVAYGEAFRHADVP
ncbi:MAG TPA: hypothetical protein VK066_02825 [Chloroflexota bacterium]|nr:hypothetical protein [Chloroflexota bacterium]